MGIDFKYGVIPVLVQPHLQSAIISTVFVESLNSPQCSKTGTMQNGFKGSTPT